MKNNYNFSRIVKFVSSFLTLLLIAQLNFATLGFMPDCSIDEGIPIPVGYPSASTTGVVGAGISYSSLEQINGNYYINGINNGVVEGKDIVGGYVKISNCTNLILRNCRISNPGLIYSIRIEATCSDITIENCEITTTTEGSTAAINAMLGQVDNLTIRNCDISGSADGIKIYSGMVVEGNYIHHLYRWYEPSNDDWTHNDCLQTLGADNVIIRGNTLMAPYQLANSTFQCVTDKYSISNIVIEDNYLSGGGHSLNVREESGRTATGVIIRNNLWEDNSYDFSPYVNQTAEVPTCYGNRFTSGGECDIVTGKCLPNNSSVSSYTATVNNFSRDRTIFDSDMARGNNNAEVTLSGTSNAPNGQQIEARAVSVDDGGATTTTWQTIATVSGGNWSGVLSTPRSSSWYRAEVKVKNSSGASVQTANRFGVGLIVFHSGQSNYARVSEVDGTATPMTIGSNGDNFQIWEIQNRGTISGSDANSIIGGPFYITDSNPRTDGLQAMAAMYNKNAPDLKVMVLWDVKPGRSQYVTLVDSDDDRLWKSIEKLFGIGAYEGTGPLADGQDVGIFVQGHVNDINETLMAEWYAATCLGKHLDGSNISGINLNDYFPTTNVFANVGRDHQTLWINHVWPEAMPGLLNGRTQVQLKEPGDVYATNSYPKVYDLYRIAHETLVDAFPEHFHKANDYPFLKRYYPDGSNSIHFDIHNIYGSPLKAQSLAASVLHQIGATPFNVPHFDIINKTSTYIELGSTSGPVTTIARSEGDNTNFTVNVNVPGTPGLAEVMGFQYSDFSQPTRVEIVDNNGNRAAEGLIRVYLDAGKTDLYYGMGAVGMYSTSIEVQEALFMRHLPIVDVGLQGRIMEHGVWVEPYTDREFINDGIPTGGGTVESVTVSPSSLSLNVGQTGNLTAVIYPDDATNKSVSWSSNNPSVATVYQGTVTTHAEGTAVITATTHDGGHTSSSTVTVGDGGTITEDINLALNKPVNVDSEYNSTYTAEKAVDGNNSDNANRWVSANSSYPHWIEVDLEQDCDVNEVKFWTGYNGYSLNPTAYKIQKWSGSAWVDIVNVTNNTQGAVSQSFASVTTDKIRLYCTAGTDNILRLYEIEVWGEIAAIANNSPTINSISDVSIEENAGQQTINLSGISDGDENTQTVNVSASSSNTSIVNNVSVNYTSGNTTGTLTYSPVEVGTATITVTVTDDGGTANGGDDTKTMNFDVVVEPVAVTSVSLNNPTLTLDIDQTGSLSATVNPADATNKSVSWSSSNPTVATVYQGDVSAHTVGTAIITVTTTDGGYTATCNLTVLSDYVEVTSVSVSPISLSLEVGQTETLTEEVAPANATNKSVSWSSSNPTVATVYQGDVTAHATGTAIITVTADGGHTATCNVNVGGTISVVTTEITASTVDVGLYDDGSRAWSGASYIRVGGGKSGHDEVAVLPFELPALESGEQVVDANFSVNLQEIKSTPTGNVDLYAIGYRSNSNVLNGDYFQAAYDTDPSNTAIQDDFFTLSSNIGVVSTDANGDVNLADFINAQYAAGAQAGDYIFLRLNCDDADIVDFRYWNITSADGATKPILTLSIGSGSAPSGPYIDEDFAAGASDFTEIAGGTWNASGGVYTLSSPASGLTGLLGNMSVHNTVISGDFELSTIMNVTETSSAWNDAAVIFNYQDVNNYYYVSFNESDDSNTNGIFKVVAGVATELADLDENIVSNIDNTVEILKEGNSITVILNGTQVANTSDATFTGGQVGYGSKNDGAVFDDLFVSAPGLTKKAIHTKAQGITVANNYQWSVYPNPCTQKQLNIVSNTTGYSTINVFDLSGKQIMKKRIESTQQSIDVSSLSKGVYIINITNGSNNNIKKLIIE